MTTFRRSLASVLIATTGLALAAASAAAPSTAARAEHRQGRPVIDTDYLYGQLYDMSSNYIYRVSGLDGPPQRPADRSNLPPNVEGWQEFYAHWKQQMTDPAVMGPMSRYLSLRDHYFRVDLGQFGRIVYGVSRFPFDSDVAEVTIPGSSCPGQRVLLAAHPDGTPAAGHYVVNQLIRKGQFDQAMQVLYSSNLGNGSAYDDTSGVTMGMAEFQALLRWWQADGTWPTRTVKIGLFDAEETGLNGSFYYASRLIPAGHQGQYVLVANMDQNGLEYPAYHWGTDHYLNNLAHGGVGPWRTNINSSPLKPNPIYPEGSAAWRNISANLPAIRHFRAALQDSVLTAFAELGAKYGFRMPLENPLLITQPGRVNPRRSAPAYTPADQAKYSPVQDDTLGRTDQVPFVSLGIPGYGVLGAYDSTPTENPYPRWYKNKPSIPQYAGYDTLRDRIEVLNVWASGTPHGVRSLAEPSIGLRRALELPATWTDYLASRPEYAGADRRPSGPLAYFETTPAHSPMAVHFDATFSADLGSTGGLHYVWDFGDGSYGTGGRVTHIYRHPAFADVRLLVVDGKGHRSGYRQAVKVGASTSAAPPTSACGRLSTAELTALTPHRAAGARPATTAWQPTPADYTDATPVIAPRRALPAAKAGRGS